MTSQILFGLAYSCLSCCAKQLHEACARLVGVQKITKTYYLFLNIFVIVPAICFFYYVDQWQWFVKAFASWLQCPEESGGQLNCYGMASVFRISLSLSLLYLLLLVIMLCRNRISKVFNEMLFFVKYLAVVGMFIGFLYVQNDKFRWYMQFSRVVGAFYLIIQMVILIDILYIWGIRWVKRYDEGSTTFAILLILFSALGYAGAIAINVYSYIQFSEKTLWPSIVTSFSLIIIPIIQLFNFNPQNSLLTTAMVCLLVSYMSMMGQCSFSDISDNVMIVDVSVATLLFFISMSGSILGLRIDNRPRVQLNQQLVAEAVEMTGQINEDQADLLNQRLENRVMEMSGYRSCDWIKWHAFMAIGSVYTAMMITNWGSPEMTGAINNIYVANIEGYWIREMVSIATSLLYIWTLVAPRLFPDRTFQIE